MGNRMYGLLNEFRTWEIKRVETCIKQIHQSQAIDNQNLSSITKQLFQLENIENKLIGNIQYGHLPHTLPYYHKIILTIYPYGTEKQFHQQYGMSPKEVADAIEEGEIIPLIRDPMEYADLEYGETLFQDKIIDKFRSYAARTHQLYSLLLGGSTYKRSYINELEYYFGNASEIYESIKNHEFFDKIDSQPLIEEPYRDSLTKTHTDNYPHGYRKQKALINYMCICAILGKELADFLINKVPTESVIRLMMYLHVVLEHGFLHGFGYPMNSAIIGQSLSTKTIQFIQKLSFREKDISSIGQLLVCPVYEPVQWGIHTIKAVKKAGLPEKISEFEQSIIDCRNSGMQKLEETNEKLRELNEFIKSLKQKGIVINNFVKKFMINGSLIGGIISLKYGKIDLASLLFTTSGLAYNVFKEEDIPFLDKIFDAYTKRRREGIYNELIEHLWSIQKI